MCEISRLEGNEGKKQSEKEGGENNVEERMGERGGPTVCVCAVCECKSELLFGQIWSSCGHQQWQLEFKLTYILFIYFNGKLSNNF